MIEARVVPAPAESSDLRRAVPEIVSVVHIIRLGVAMLYAIRVDPAVEEFGRDRESLPARLLGWLVDYGIHLENAPALVD